MRNVLFFWIAVLASVAITAFAMDFGERAMVSVYTDPALNVTGAAPGSVFNVTSPSCRSTVLFRSCNVKCLNTANCPQNQYFTKQPAVAYGENATLCTYTYTTTTGMNAGQWGLVAVSMCQ